MIINEFLVISPILAFILCLFVTFFSNSEKPNSQNKYDRKRNSECKGTSMEIIQYEEEREKKIGKKMNKASGTCRTIPKDLIYM